MGVSSRLATSAPYAIAAAAYNSQVHILHEAASSALAATSVILVMAALTDGTGAITVNVGGTVYMTTLATLTRVEGSMLGAMAEALSDGEVLFIDRDGPSFRYVLNYLRDPFAKPLLPRDPAERDQLAREADFYGLPGLFCTLSLAGPFVASRGNQVATVDTHENYELAFTMELARDWVAMLGYWQSVLHIGHSKDQCFPGIWFHTNQNALHVKHGLSTAASQPCPDHLRHLQSPGNWGVEATSATFFPGEKYDIRVVVQSNQMTVYVDGDIVGAASGSATEVATDAPVYVGDPWRGPAMGAVTLSDISYTAR